MDFISWPDVGLIVLTANLALTIYVVRVINDLGSRSHLLYGLMRR